MNKNTDVLLKNKTDKIKKKHLTARETEYLSLVAMGFKNSEIAKILSVTDSTVKKTLEAVFQKLFAKDRANAVAIAFMHDILNVQILSFVVKKYKVNKYHLYSE